MLEFEQKRTFLGEGVRSCRSSGVQSRQVNPECEEEHVIETKARLGNTKQGPSGSRNPPGKGWPPAGSEHCVVVSNGGTKRMERCQSRVIEPRNNDQRWSLRSLNSGGRIEAPSEAWRGDPTGVREQGKSTKGYPGNLREPTVFLHKRKNRSKVARPEDQRPGVAEATPGARDERKKWSSGGNRRSKETKSEGTSSRKS